MNDTEHRPLTRPWQGQSATPLPRAMPSSLDGECSILSCLLHNPTALMPDARNTIPQEAFYHPHCRLLYDLFQQFHEDERPVEYIALSQHLQDKGMIDKIGGQGTLAELLDFVPTPTHYGYYRSILLDKLKLRRIITACTESIENAYEYQEDVPKLMETVTDRFFGLSKQEDGPKHREFKEAIHSYIDVWEARLSGKIEAGIPTRWPSFNRTFGGITPRVWLITAYPSDGKSTLLQNMCEDVCAHGKHALLFSFEMDETEILDRMVTARSKLPSQKIFFPQNGIDRNDARCITRALDEMQQWGMHLRCENWTLEQVLSESRAMALKYPLGLIGLDYLQLMQSAKKFGNKAEETAHISRSLKRLSRSINLPVVVLSQLNDEGRTLDSRAPNQDASNAVYIQAGSVTYEKGKRIEVKQGLKVVKNRNAKRGELLPITLDGPTFSFVEHQPDGPPLPDREWN